MLRRLGYQRVDAGAGANDALPDRMPRAAPTWHPERDGGPKIHYSSQAAGLRAGAPADYVDAAEFADSLRSRRLMWSSTACWRRKSKDGALFRARESLGIAA